MTKQKIGVLGAGNMGNGISQTFSVCGNEVVMVDIGQASLSRAMNTIQSSLDRLIRKEKISAQDKEAVLSRILPSLDIAALADCDLLIEAASENLETKLDLFAKLDELARPEAILASNDS